MNASPDNELVFSIRLAKDITPSTIYIYDDDLNWAYNRLVKQAKFYEKNNINIDEDTLHREIYHVALEFIHYRTNIPITMAGNRAIDLIAHTICKTCL